LGFDLDARYWLILLPCENEARHGITIEERKNMNAATNIHRKSKDNWLHSPAKLTAVTFLSTVVLLLIVLNGAEKVRDTTSSIRQQLNEVLVGSTTGSAPTLPMSGGWREPRFGSPAPAPAYQDWQSNQTNIATASHAYMVPVHVSTGMRMKMIVNQ